MKKNLQPILLALTGLLVFSSCSSTRQMMDRRRSGMEIPEEAEPYPKPTPRQQQPVPCERFVPRAELCHPHLVSAR